MAEAVSPGIALLACQQRQRKLLAEVLSEFGYRLVYAADPAGLDCLQLAGIQADLWLLELAEESELADWLLEHSQVPLLFGAGEIPAEQSSDYPRWKHRLYSKLQGMLGLPLSGQEPSLAAAVPRVAAGQCPAHSVWLLAGSLGGPAAVKGFLDRLPADLPLAFIYAQHIDAGFERQLPQILGRDNDWRILNCQQGFVLQAGEVLVAPISTRLEFDLDGHVQLSDVPWPGPYQPSIEALLDQLAAVFAPACGAIIFSGMGEDGVQACGRLRSKGIQVWTQSAVSAACAVMPQAVRAAGYSCVDGSPEELASAMRHWLEHESPVAH